MHDNPRSDPAAEDSMLQRQKATNETPRRRKADRPAPRPAVAQEPAPQLAAGQLPEHVQAWHKDIAPMTLDGLAAGVAYYFPELAGRKG